MLTLFSLLTIAVAAPTGDPVPLTDEGRFVLGARLGTETVWERDAGCLEGSEDDETECDGSWRRGGYIATGRFVLADGLALDGEIGWQNDRLRQANYRGSGLMYALGLRGAVPMGQSGWWVSAVGRFERGLGSDTTPEEYEQSLYRVGSATALVAWRDVNISAWLGGQGAWMWEHNIEQRTSKDAEIAVFQIPLDAAIPVAGVFGLELISDPLGPGWTAPWRLSIGFEGLLGQTVGVHGWVTVRY